jgi:hypothetical protein
VASTPAAGASAKNDLAFLDAIVTPELVFPDPATRQLYDAIPPETSQEGWRSYGFLLKPQPGMTPERHFHIVSVTWAPAGTLPQGLRGIGGPNGGFVDWAASTADGLYDIRVSEGTLLPDTVVLPEFELEETTERLLQGYSRRRP